MYMIVFLYYVLSRNIEFTGFGLFLRRLLIASDDITALIFANVLEDWVFSVFGLSLLTSVLQTICLSQP